MTYRVIGRAAICAPGSNATTGKINQEHCGLMTAGRVCVRQRLVTRLGKAHQLCARRCRVRAQSSPQDDAADRLSEVRALQEALDLYQQAQEVSQQQVMQELMQMELSDMAYYKAEEAVSTPSISSSAPALGSVRRVPISPSALKPLQNFWLEQGLLPHVAQSIAQEMVASGSPYCNIAMLEAQVMRLSRIIPSRVQDMVARDWHILNATPGTIAQHYVQLVQLFPNAQDVSELACKQPRLLYCENLVNQFEAVVNKLSELHPAHSIEEARSLLVEYPDLIFRMSYYMHVRTLDELPMELQNMFVYTGQGLHHLHQIHSNSISPRFL